MNVSVVKACISTVKGSKSAGVAFVAGFGPGCL